MAAQKLFSDFPTGVGGVSPVITADITQKSAEDDPNTLAGYKKRLQLQRAEEEGAYQSKLGYQRGLQLQWEKEDLKRQAEQTRMLDKQRREAFDVIYRPKAISDIRMGQENQRAMTGLSNQQIANQNNMASRPGVIAGPTPGSFSIPGFGIVGPALGGPQPSQVQQVINTAYGQNAQMQQGANTNPYYRNPYI
jgi:hypothetical protein